jgi:hypothetical protein
MIKTRQLLVLLILTSIGFGCSNDNSESNENTDMDNSEYLYFISGKINGEDFLYGQRTDDTSLNYQIVSSIPLEGATCAYSIDQGLDYKINYGSSIYPNFDNEDSQPQIGIDFLRFYRCSDSQSSTEVFNDIFPIGNYEYSIDNNNYGIMSQIGINYSPIASGNEYYESYGTIESSNSFTITDSQEDNGFSQSQLIKGQFSAKLYNVNDSSDFVEITEGRFKITISK